MHCYRKLDMYDILGIHKYCVEALGTFSIGIRYLPRSKNDEIAAG